MFYIRGMSLTDVSVIASVRVEFSDKILKFVVSKL